MLELKTFNAEDRIDYLYSRLLASNNNFSELWLVVQRVLILSHGNGRVEAGFTVNKDILLTNMKQGTLVAQRIVHDAIMAAGGPLKVTISRELLASVKLARGKYECAKEQQRKSNTDADKLRMERKRKMEKLQQLEEEKSKLMKNSSDSIAAINAKITGLRNSI